MSLNSAPDLPAVLDAMSIGSEDHFSRFHPNTVGMITVVVERVGVSEWVLFTTEEDEEECVRVKNPILERVSALITQLLRTAPKSIKTWASCPSSNAHGVSYIIEGMNNE